MIFTIARKEAAEMLRDGRFRWAAAAVSVLLLVSLATGWAHHRQAEADRTAAAVADREVWVGQGEKNQHAATHFGMWAFKPTDAMTAADPGVLPYTGTALFMESHNVRDAAYRPAEDTTSTGRLGRLTAAVTLQFLVPLLVLLLAYPAFVGERESGTLRQALSLGVGRGRMAIGKGLGVAVPIGIIVVPATVVGVAALAVFEGVGGLARLALWAGVYLVYFAIVLSLALVVSAAARSSRTALVGLLGFWLVTGFIVPRVAADAAAAIHPTPTAPAFEAAVRAERDALRAVQGDPHAQAPTPRSAGERLFQGEQRETELYRRHFEALARTHEAQGRVVQAASVLSPLLAVQVLSMGLAGSDDAHHRHFAQAAETHRYDYVQALNQDMIDSGGRGYMAGADLWERIGAFEYQPPGVAWAVRPYGIAAASLGLWLVALAAVLPFAVRRMRVT